MVFAGALVRALPKLLQDSSGYADPMANGQIIIHARELVADDPWGRRPSAPGTAPAGADSAFEGDAVKAAGGDGGGGQVEGGGIGGARRSSVIMSPKDDSGSVGAHSPLVESGGESAYVPRVDRWVKAVELEVRGASGNGVKWMRGWVWGT